MLKKPEKKPVVKKRKPEARKYDSSVRDLFSKIGSQGSHSSLLSPSAILNNGPNTINNESNKYNQHPE